MNLNYYYWYFSKALSTKFCDEVIMYAKKNQEETATIDNMGLNRNLNKEPFSKEELKILKNKRDSNVIWLNQKWILKEIEPYIHEANKLAGWNFDWDFSEPCQFTKYKKNQFYHWHTDSFNEPYNRPNDINLHGKIRKLSVTCSLSDSSEYKGGELEFNFNNPEKNKKQNLIKCTEILPRGSIVVFPSFVWHRVCPVKQGTRYSLVIWNLGYPYR